MAPVFFEAVIEEYLRTWKRLILRICVGDIDASSSANLVDADHGALAQSELLEPRMKELAAERRSIIDGFSSIMATTLSRQETGAFSFSSEEQDSIQVRFNRRLRKMNSRL